MIQPIINWISNIFRKIFRLKETKVISGIKTRKDFQRNYTLTSEEWKIAEAYFHNLGKGLTCSLSRVNGGLSEWKLHLFKGNARFKEKRDKILSNRKKHRKEFKTNSKKESNLTRKEKTNIKIVNALKLYSRGDVRTLTEAFILSDIHPVTYSGKRTIKEREELKEQALKEIGIENSKKTKIVLKKSSKKKQNSKTIIKKSVKKPEVKESESVEPVPVEPIPTEPMVLEPRVKSKPKKTKLIRGKKTKITPTHIQKYKEVCDLVEKGTPVMESWAIVKIGKDIFYRVKKENPKLEQRLAEARKAGKVIQHEAKKNKVDVVKRIELAKIQAKKERERNPQEVKAVMEDSDATKQVVGRIEEALTDHLGGEPLENALSIHKVSLAKYLQLLRLDILDIIDSDVYAKEEFSKL